MGRFRNKRIPLATSGIQGCQIFLGKTYQNGENVPQMTIKYTKWPYNIPNDHKIDQITINRSNGHKIYQHILQDPPKFTRKLGLLV
jgi:hypothetical protein